jgi:predicted Zn-dependent protease
MQGRRFQMAQESDQSGVSVRVLKDQRLARASTDGIGERDLAWAVDRALASVDHVPRSPAFDRFPDPSGDPGSPTQVHPEVADPDPDRAVGIADQVHDRVQRAEGVDYHEVVFGAGRGTYALANSQGHTAWDRNAFEQCSLELRFEHEGEHKYTREAIYSREPLSLGPRLRGAVEDAVEQVERIGDRGSLDGATDTVLFDPVAVNALVKKVAAAASGLAADQDRSRFAGRLGERVAAPETTLVDRPRSPEGMRIQRTDDEGLPATTTPIVEHGVLRSYLYDWAGALEAEAEPSGHGFRPSSDRHDGSPAPRTCNLELAPGDWTHEEMVEDVADGVYVIGPFLGSFTASSVTGDFSLVAPLAFRIRGGEIRHAVPSTTVTGNVFDMLEDVRAVGAERKRLSNGASSALLVDGVNCVA